jgi:hypothetical protein
VELRDFGNYIALEIYLSAVSQVYNPSTKPSTPASLNKETYLSAVPQVYNPSTRSWFKQKPMFRLSTLTPNPQMLPEANPDEIDVYSLRTPEVEAAFRELEDAALSVRILNPQL